MVFNLLPVELQVQVCSYLNRPQLERLACTNRQCNAVVNRYEYRWPLHRLSLVIQGESQLYRLHNFDAGAMQQVTHVAFYRLLRRARIEFILLTEDPDFPMPNLDHLPRQLWRFRRYWTEARIDFRHLPIAQPAWNRVLNLFGNANRWYFHATYFLFPVPEVLSGHHRHRVAEARMVTMQPPAARLFEYLQLPRTDGGSGRRLIISEGCFQAYAFLTQLQHLYASLESPPPGPFAVLVLQPKEQWNDYRYYSRPLRQLLLYATAPRNPRADGTLHFGEDHLGDHIYENKLPKGRKILFVLF